MNNEDGYEIAFDIPWWDLLVQLNDLRESKDKIATTIEYRIVDDFLEVKLIGTNCQSKYPLPPQVKDYIDDIVKSEAIRLILKNIEEIKKIPDTTIDDFKVFREVVNMIISEIILEFNKDFKKYSFDAYYYWAKSNVFYNISDDVFIFTDWSKLKEHVEIQLSNLGYIVVNNKIQKL